MKRRLFIVPVITLLILAGVAMVVVIKKDPPTAEIKKARILLTEAGKMHSSEYSGVLFQQASMYFDSAMKEWNVENDRFILFRDYEKVRALAALSTEKSADAMENTREIASGAKEILWRRIAEIESKFQDFQDRYNSFPFDYNDRNDLVNGTLFLNEGILAFRQANYLNCAARLDSAETLVTVLLEKYNEKLEVYLSQYELWQSWIDQTISHSQRNHTGCIVVDKLARECILYRHGKIEQKMQIELGANWMGDKNSQGDKSTPEGRYKIVSKKSKGSTRYYKALLLNYPNQADKERFMANKKKGLLHRDASIGNLIEIHGSGGKGMDWTDGCVALRDADMDKLFEFSEVNMQVTIVGSTLPLSKFYAEGK